MSESRELTLLATAAAIPLTVLALAACGSGRATSSPAPPETAATPTTAAAPAAPRVLTSLQQSLTTTIGRVMPEVVQISNRQGLGSGVAFNRNGDIVTNAHVAAGGGPLSSRVGWCGRRRVQPGRMR